MENALGDDMFGDWPGLHQFFFFLTYLECSVLYMLVTREYRLRLVEILYIHFQVWWIRSVLSLFQTIQIRSSDFVKDILHFLESYAFTIIFWIKFLFHAKKDLIKHNHNSTGIDILRQNIMGLNMDQWLCSIWRNAKR